MRLSRFIACLLLSLPLCACSIAHEITPYYLNSQHPEDAVILIGISPTGTSIKMASGDVSGGWFYFDEGLFGGDSFSVTSHDGYAVTSLRPPKKGEWFGLYYASMPYGMPSSASCRGGKLFIFFVRPGDVLYLGDFRFSQGSGPVLGSDLQSATVYFSKKYPAFSAALIQSLFKQSTLQNEGLIPTEC